jgi:hypothetical protein
LPRAVGLYAVQLASAITEGLNTVHSPVVDDWYHGGMLGEQLDNHKVRRRLARACVPVVPIDPNEYAKVKADLAAAAAARATQ